MRFGRFCAGEFPEVYVDGDFSNLRLPGLEVLGVQGPRPQDLRILSSGLRPPYMRGALLGEFRFFSLRALSFGALHSEPQARRSIGNM